MAKFRIFVATDRVGSKCEYVAEIDDEDLEDMSDDEKDEVLLEALWDSGMVDWWWEPTPPEGE